MAPHVLSSHKIKQGSYPCEYLEKILENMFFPLINSLDELAESLQTQKVRYSNFEDNLLSQLWYTASAFPNA